MINLAEQLRKIYHLHSKVFSKPFSIKFMYYILFFIGCNSLDNYVFSYDIYPDIVFICFTKS